MDVGKGHSWKQQRWPSLKKKGSESQGVAVSRNLSAGKSRSLGRSNCRGAEGLLRAYSCLATGSAVRRRRSCSMLFRTSWRW